MERRRKAVCWVVLAIGLTAGAVQAGEMQTISYELDLYTPRGSFPETTNQDSFVGGMWQVPRFDPSQGVLHRVRVFLHVDGAGTTKAEFENESPTDPYTIVAELGGSLQADLPVDYQYGAGIRLSTSSIEVYCHLSKDTDSGAPDWVGTDYRSAQAARNTPTQAQYTYNNSDPETAGNDDMFIADFVMQDGQPTWDMNWTLFSCGARGGYVPGQMVEHRFDPNWVDADVTVEYRYEVPEPASMTLLALGGMAVLLRRRRR